MKNCLSNRKFENLLFVDVQIQGREATALFDTGAGMSVIARSLLDALDGVQKSEALSAGNNNGLVRTLPTAVISSVQIGDVRLDSLRVIVMADADFAFSDDNGRKFPARMLLGWDVISRYCWQYSAQNETLFATKSQGATAASDPDSKQGPVVFPQYAGRPFKARVDTGHTGSVLSAAWHTRIPDIERHETENVGIGSVQHASTPYVKDLPIMFQGQVIHLRNADICGQIYGQPDDIEALLGYDFLEGRDWMLDREFQLLDPA